MEAHDSSGYRPPAGGLAIPVGALTAVAGRLLRYHQAMFVFPDFDPIALQIGPLAIRWYGLMYLLAFGLFLGLGKQRAKAEPRSA